MSLGVCHAVRVFVSAALVSRAKVMCCILSSVVATVLCSWWWCCCDWSGNATLQCMDSVRRHRADPTPSHRGCTRWQPESSRWNHSVESLAASAPTRCCMNICHCLSASQLQTRKFMFVFCFDKSTKTQMAWACSPTWCVIARRSRRQDDWETYKREKETTADEQHMRGIRNSKETSWRQMSVMCLSDGSHWPATTAEYQKKKKKKFCFAHRCVQMFFRTRVVA